MTASCGRALRHCTLPLHCSSDVMRPPPTERGGLVVACLPGVPIKSARYTMLRPVHLSYGALTVTRNAIPGRSCSSSTTESKARQAADHKTDGGGLGNGVHFEIVNTD